MLHELHSDHCEKRPSMTRVHTCVLHGWLPCRALASGHAAPPNNGGAHALLRVCTPPPHDTEHDEKDDHSDSTACTGGRATEHELPVKPLFG